MNFRTSAALLLPLASLPLVSCRTMDRMMGRSALDLDKGSVTCDNITEAADEIELGMQQLDVTLAALHSLVERPASDLTAQRETYEDALDDLEGTVKDLRETAEDMRDMGQDYFTEWDDQIAGIRNEEVRQLSTERRKEIEQSFTEVEDQYAQAKSSFEPLLTDLRDIRTALRVDTTVAGIEALQPVVSKVDTEAETVKESLEGVAQRFREACVELSRNGAQARPGAKDGRNEPQPSDSERSEPGPQQQPQPGTESQPSTPRNGSESNVTPPQNQKPRPQAEVGDQQPRSETGAR